VRVQMHSHHRMQQLHPPQMHINWAHFSARSFSRFDNSIIFVFVRLATADNGCGVGRHYVVMNFGGERDPARAPGAQ
jgi:hypothetical protein